MESLEEKIKECVNESMITIWNELNFLEDAVRSGEYSNEYIANRIRNLKDLVD